MKVAIKFENKEDLIYCVRKLKKYLDGGTEANISKIMSWTDKFSDEILCIRIYDLGVHGLCCSYATWDYYKATNIYTKCEIIEYKDFKKLVLDNLT